MVVNWTAVGALATAVTGVIILVSVVVLALQIRELRRASYAQAYASAVGWLQSEDMRAARRALFDLRGKALPDWTHDERWACEKVCQSYDIVAIMIRHGMLPKEILVENWQQSLIASWNAARPLVEEFRKEYAFPEKWDDFEWLARQAEQRAGRKSG